MDVKLFSLCKQETPETKAGMKHIVRCVKAFFPECNGINNFTSQKRMLLAASQSLQAADIVVIAVQSNMYNATKKLLAGALDLKIAKNRAVANALTDSLEKGEIKQSTFESNIRFPHGAVIMPTDNYINCGFILSAGSQHIVYLPLEAPKADEVVYGSMFDFFREISEENAEDAFRKRHRLIVSRTLDKLNEDSVTVAFAGGSTTDVISHLVDGLSFKDCFSFSDITVNEYSSSEDMIDAAREARDEQRSQLSVVISPIKTNENSERFISVAIADENGTTTFDFSAENGESEAELTLNCIDKVMLLLYSHEKLTDNSDPADIETKSDKTIRTALFKAASIAVGATAIVSILIALIAK
jgi:hypothetical protein